MRCPSPKRLKAAFPQLTDAQVRVIRLLAALAGDGTLLKQAVSLYAPMATVQYVRQMHSSPYSSQMWRVTVVLHAIDDILGTHGVEALGPDVGGSNPPPYEYLNSGDTYGTTLIYTRATDTLRIGCWGDIAERHPWGGSR